MIDPSIEWIDGYMVNGRISVHSSFLAEEIITEVKIAKEGDRTIVWPLGGRPRPVPDKCFTFLTFEEAKEKVREIFDLKIQNRLASIAYQTELIEQEARILEKTRMLKEKVLTGK